MGSGRKHLVPCQSAVHAREKNSFSASLWGGHCSKTLRRLGIAHWCAETGSICPWAGQPRRGKPGSCCLTLVLSGAKVESPTTTLTPSLRATAVASASLLASPWDPYGSDGLFRPRFVWIHAAAESWDEKGSLLIIQPPGSHPRLRISEPPDAEPGSVFL